ncbi:unnamed protein product, partial [Meganyctiphanes norvegica]
APPVKDVSPGELVCGQESGTWYRSEVIQILDKEVKVFFVDFGNESTLGLEDIRKTSENLMGLHKMAVKINLKGVNLKDDFKKKLLEYISLEVPLKIRIEALNPVVASIADEINLNINLQEEIQNGQDAESSVKECSPPEELHNIPSPKSIFNTRDTTKVEPLKVPLPSSEKTSLTSTSPSSKAVDSPSGTQGM